MRWTFGGALLLALVACDGSDAPGPSLTLGDLPANLTLKVGQTAVIGGVSILFSAVKNDSRCPANAVCVWAGNAELLFTVGPRAGEGPVVQVPLNTFLEPKSGSALGLSLSVIGLGPGPNYVVDLRVERK